MSSAASFLSLLPAQAGLASRVKYAAHAGRQAVRPCTAQPHEAEHAAAQQPPKQHLAPAATRRNTCAAGRRSLPACRGAAPPAAAPCLPPAPRWTGCAPRCAWAPPPTPLRPRGTPAGVYQGAKRRAVGAMQGVENREALPRATAAHLEEGLQACHRLLIRLHSLAVLQRPQARAVECQELGPALGQALRGGRRVPPRVALPRLEHRLLCHAAADRHQLTQLRACTAAVGDRRHRQMSEGGAEMRLGHHTGRQRHAPSWRLMAAATACRYCGKLIAAAPGCGPETACYVSLCGCPTFCRQTQGGEMRARCRRRWWRRRSDGALRSRRRDAGHLANRLQRSQVGGDAPAVGGRLPKSMAALQLWRLFAATVISMPAGCAVG